MIYKIFIFNAIATKIDRYFVDIGMFRFWTF